MGRYTNEGECMSCVNSNQDDLPMNNEICFNCSRYYSDKWQDKRIKQEFENAVKELENKV